MEVCNEIVMKRINEIKPYVRNPRKNNKTVDLLCKIIPKVGFNVPLVIDEKGTIVKGHARYTAAIRLGMEEVPCIITHADEEAIKADRIADNKISEFSEWVNDELLHELDMIDFDIDFSELGFPTMSFNDMDFNTAVDDVVNVSDEERKKLYEQFLKEQEAQYAKSAEIANENDIKRAMANQANVPVAPPKYYKVVCEKCGHIMFVDSHTVWSPENGLEHV